MSPLISGLRPGGRMVVVGASLDPITVSTIDLNLWYPHDHREHYRKRH